MSFLEIIFNIDSFVAQRGDPYREWYVGISKKPVERLFIQHKVCQDGYCVCLLADSATVARDAESHFLNLGMDGGPGGGDEDSKFVYVYRKSYGTNP